MRDLRRAVANFHRVRPSRVEVFEDDASLYEARRAQRLRREGEHRRRARRPSLSVWWDDASPLERFGRIWWWAICALVGILVGSAAVTLAYALFT